MAEVTGAPKESIQSMTINVLVAAVMQEEASRSLHKPHGKHQVLMAGKAQSKFSKGSSSKGQKSKPYGSAETPNPKRTGSCRWCGLPNH